MDELKTLFSGADEPRRLPDELRTRLEGVLTGRPSHVEADFRGIDEGRPLPPRLQSKLRRTLERRRVAAWQIASAITAAAAVLIGLVVLPNGVRRSTSEPNAIAPTTIPPSTGGSAGIPEPAPTSPGVTPRTVLPAEGAAADSPTGFRGSPPPYVVMFAGRSRSFPAVGSGSSPGAPAPQPAPAPGPPPPPVPARIAVTGSDPDIAAGFHAYVALVRAQRDVGNRTLEIVSPSAPDELVTVNLGTAPLGSGGSSPVLETLDVPGSALTANVFDISSLPLRQARVLVGQILATTDLASEATPTAAIYRAGGGEFAEVIPNELAGILQDAGVVALRLDYSTDRPAFVPADIAFVSMPPNEARSFAREARAAGYAPRLGFAGIWSLYDDAVRAELGTTARIISPYWATGGEFDAIKRGVEARGGRMGAEAIHGWATAKAIAVALYETDPRSPSAMARALGREMGLRVCPYKLRESTHERYPDGLLLEMTRTSVRSVSGYLTDPR